MGQSYRVLRVVASSLVCLVSVIAGLSWATDNGLVSLGPHDPGLNLEEDERDSVPLLELNSDSPVVTVTSPNGGETWWYYYDHDISWTAFDPDGIDSISILYSVDGGDSYSLIASGEPNDGVYSWNVQPEDKTDLALVKVVAYDPSLNVGEDVSDCFFAIVQNFWPNRHGKWALHYAGPHNAKTNTCSFEVTDCSADVVVDAPSGSGRYDIYVIAVDVDAVAGSRYGIRCSGSFYFYGWTRCSDSEIPTPSWPDCGEGNAQTWDSEQPGPYVTMGILDVYCYPGASWIGADDDPRVGYAEFCDDSWPEPWCVERRQHDYPELFGVVGFGTPGENPCVAPPDYIPPDVEVLAPNGGDTLEVYTSFDVTWTASDENGVESVSIYYSENGGWSYDLVASGESNDGVYEWYVPNTSTDSALVIVVAYDQWPNSKADVSDSLFMIREPTGDAPGGSSHPGDSVVLWQNRPNPFTRGTNVSFYLPTDACVHLEVFDVSGRLVEVLIDGAMRKAGVHTVPWNGTGRDGRELSSGVYFYRLRAGEFGETRKMLLAQ